MENIKFDAFVGLPKLYCFCNLRHGFQEYGAVYCEKQVPTVVRNCGYSQPLVCINQTWRPHIPEHC